MFIPRNLNREKPIWETCEGRKLPKTFITHQHWSNIYWYNKIFSTDPKNCFKGRMSSLVTFAESNLQSLYGGKILEYKPVYVFEINWLKNMINVSIQEREIYFEGKKVGTVSDNLKKV